MAEQTTNKQHYGIWPAMLNPAMVAHNAPPRTKKLECNKIFPLRTWLSQEPKAGKVPAGVVTVSALLIPSRIAERTTSAAAL